MSDHSPSDQTISAQDLSDQNSSDQGLGDQNLVDQNGGEPRAGDQDGGGRTSSRLTSAIIRASGRNVIDKEVFQAAVYKTRMPMALVDPNLPDAPLVYVNDAFLALTGYDEDEVVGHNCRFLQGPDTDPAAVQRVRDAIARRESILEELYNYRKDGSGFWNELLVSPVFDEHGDLSYFFASQCDVSPRREASRRQTQRLDSMGALVSGVAHEFNNLMTVVLGSLEQIATRSADTDLRRFAERADRAAKRAGRFASELLSLAGRQGHEEIVLDISTLLRGYVATLAAAMGPGVRIDLDLAPATLVRLDRDRFERVVFNLVDNANAAMPAGGIISLTTRLLPAEALSQEGDRVELVVADTGQGMSPAVMTRATELFFTTKPASESWGLGLFLALEFVDASGGRMAIDSQVGLGTKVSLAFPYAAPDPAAGSDTPA